MAVCALSSALFFPRQVYNRQGGRGLRLIAAEGIQGLDLHTPYKYLSKDLGVNRAI